MLTVNTTFPASSAASALPTDSTEASFSTMVTVTLPAVTPAYSPVPVTVWVRVTAASDAASSSAPAVTVTVCAVSQVDAVKVRLVWSRLMSVPAWPAMATVTSSVGCVSRTTV